MARVELRGLRKQFGTGVVALDRLELEVASGELVSLLGPSGCQLGTGGSPRPLGT